ncbi:MAG: selenocysteine-specific translation elongation factor, partial [candidate division Zixibacteria bacterium]|nr:selenocysteine-specific translation elongation factor [candidate division Zixibacteria bacterium]
MVVNSVSIYERFYRIRKNSWFRSSLNLSTICNNMFVLGTAGHIDHGKSSIINRLTGIDPDRLPEEKARGLTIDLGFAWMQLPSGEQVGFVDVPGHEKFVKNMIAGVGSIDAALLVIAADDGWMPQTEEHLQILELLGVKGGLIILNKIDIVEPDWVELVISDIESQLKDRKIQFSGIIPVSAYNGSGFEELISSIDNLLKQEQSRPDIGKPRLYADRAFTITGMGSIFTGTLIGGKFKTGQEAELCPIDEKVRIRSLQTHKESIDVAVPGSRVAVNVTGGEKRNFKRGIMVSGLNNLHTESLLNCHLNIPSQSKIPLKHNSEIVFLLGTAEILGRVLLLENEILKPGENGLAKIRLPEDVCPFIGDKFILRKPSPATTIGGGVILDFKIHKRIKKDSKEIEYLNDIYPPTVESIVTALLNYQGVVGPDEFIYFRNSIFRDDEYSDYINQLVSEGKLLKSKDYYYSETFLKANSEIIRGRLDKFHKSLPWAPGLGAKELLDKAGVDSGNIGMAFLELLQLRNLLNCEKGIYRLLEHSTNLPPKMQTIAAGLIGLYRNTPFDSMTRQDVEKKGADYQVVIKYLIGT